MNINGLTSAEEHLMKVLWELDSFYSREILEKHPDPKPHQNTISTYLKILIEKQYLTIKKEGRIFKYTVAISYKEYKKMLLGKMIQEHFENSSVDLVKMLLKEKMLKEKDLEIFSKESNDIKTPEKIEQNEKSAFSNYIIELTKPEKKDKKKKKKKKKK